MSDGDGEKTERIIYHSPHKLILTNSENVEIFQELWFKWNFSVWLITDETNTLP